MLDADRNGHINSLKSLAAGLGGQRRFIKMHGWPSLTWLGAMGKAGSGWAAR